MNVYSFHFIPSKCLSVGCTGIRWKAILISFLAICVSGPKLMIFCAASSTVMYWIELRELGIPSLTLWCTGCERSTTYQAPFFLLVTLGYYSISGGLYSRYDSLTERGSYSWGGDFGMEVIFNYLRMIVGTLKALCCWLEHTVLIIETDMKTLRNPL